MGYWKCEICGTEFDNFHAQGFDNKVYCPLCFFKEKTNRLEKIRTQLKEENEKIKIAIIENCDLRLEVLKYKEVIEEVRQEVCEYKKIMEDGIEQGAYYSYLGSLQQRLEKLLQILDKAKGEDND